MNNKNRFSLPPKYLLLLLGIFCVGAMFVTFVSNVRIAPVKNVLGFIVTPMQKGINSIGAVLGDKNLEWKTLEEVQKENEKLNEQLDALKVENSQLLLDRYELDRLRELYQLDEKYAGYEKVAARVIAKDAGNWFSGFILDKGEKDGIQRDMNVIAGSGLVGIVAETGENWARVRSIIDDESNVSSMILATQDLCIVKGNLSLLSDNVIEFQKLVDSDNNVAVGDQIVTSNVSGKYLEGILIGYVTEIKEDANHLTKSGLVSPAVDFEHISEVLIIKNLKEQPQTEE